MTVIHCDGHDFRTTRDGNLIRYRCVKCELKVKTHGAMLMLTGKKS